MIETHSRGSLFEDPLFEGDLIQESLIQIRLFWLGPYSGGRALFQTSGVEPHLKGVLFKVNLNLENLLEVIIIRGRYFYRVHYTRR